MKHAGHPDSYKPHSNKGKLFFNCMSLDINRNFWPPPLMSSSTLNPLPLVKLQKEKKLWAEHQQIFDAKLTPRICYSMVQLFCQLHPKFNRMIFWRLIHFFLLEAQNKEKNAFNEKVTSDFCDPPLLSTRQKTLSTVGTVLLRKAAALH